MEREYRITPAAGDFVEPDGWGSGDFLLTDTFTPGYRDNDFPGCMFRLDSRHGQLAVNIVITGKPHLAGYGQGFWSRCRIEFVGDGAPSEFCGGKIWTKDIYREHEI